MKLRVYASTNKVGSRCETTVEIDDEELEGMDANERNAYLEEMAKDALWQLVEWSWEESP